VDKKKLLVMSTGVAGREEESSFTRIPNAVEAIASSSK
jgi:hypothetical protein